MNSKATKSIDYYFIEEIAKRIQEVYTSNPLERFIKIIQQIQLVVLKRMVASTSIPWLDYALGIIPDVLSQLFKYGSSRYFMEN